jgi:D-glycero-D-manno-heptose 1,7-bisphosphate phosphatase
MIQLLRPAVFLDRDGVLIHTNVVAGKPYAIRNLAEYHLLPGVKGACNRLKAAGFMLVVVTNQPDLDNQLVTPETMAAIHARLYEDLPLDGIYTCPHDKRRGCSCRKPQPGLLVQAAVELTLDLRKSWMVGDRASDVAAGNSAGCRAVFIDCGYGEPKPENPDAVARSLAEAAEVILTSEAM